MAAAVRRQTSGSSARRSRSTARRYEIVGVLPRWFHPDISAWLREEEIWAPKVLQNFELRTTGAPGTGAWSPVSRRAWTSTRRAPSSRRSPISSRASFPNTLGTHDGDASSRSAITSPGRSASRFASLFGAVVLVLLLGCANVASLLLAQSRRSATRVRVARGDRRQRLADDPSDARRECRPVPAGLSGRTGVAHAAIGALRRARLEHRAAAGRARARSASDRLCARRSIADRDPRRPLAGNPALARGDCETGCTEGRQHDRRARSTPLRVVAGRVRSGARARPARVSAGLLIRSFADARPGRSGIRKSNVAVLQVFAYGESVPNDGATTGVLRPDARAHSSVPGVERPVSCRRCRSLRPTSTSRADSGSRAAGTAGTRTTQHVPDGRDRGLLPRDGHPAEAGRAVHR